MGNYSWWQRWRRNLYLKWGRTSPPGTKRDGIPVPLIVTLIAVILIVGSFFFVELRLRPIIATLAKAEVENSFTNVLDQAILSDLTQRGTGYEDFVTIERDEDGTICALSTNMAAMNLLRAELENEISEILSQMDASTISIPLGSLLQSDLLWGRGPAIEAKSMAVGVLNSEFVSEFTSAGINQTSHRIYLDIRVPLSIILAGGTVETEISTYLCVAETIIVGTVPSAYLQLQ